MARLRKSPIRITAPLPAEEQAGIPKHRRIFDYLSSRIKSGELAPGDRLPSEAELGRIFNASRVTVGKALHDLRQMNLVTRRPGAGTHVQAAQHQATRSLGLLIPDLGRTEIFEPIAQGMMRSPFARNVVLVWGNAASASDDVARQTEQMVQSLIAEKVEGVFFAPLEMVPNRDVVNRRIAQDFERAQIPIVLLDRCYMPYPERSQHDLVGVDNRRAGYMATTHLIQHGAQRLAFVCREGSANTIDARITGFLEAIRLRNIAQTLPSVWMGDPKAESFVERMMATVQPEGIVCANDLTAAQLMQTLLRLGIRIPADVRLVGMDDIKYAALLPVPLTTVHQDCFGLGMRAMETMLQRLEHPELPVCDVLVPTRLVVRQSCGAHPAV